MSKDHLTTPLARTGSLGDWLRKMREIKGVPIRVVAAATDMDQALLSKIELGRRIPTIDQSIALARYFGVDSHEIEARRIAERFRREYANNPAAEKAVQLLNEAQPNE